MSVGRSQALANERCCLCELERLRSLGGGDLTPQTLGSYRQETEQGAQSST